MQVYWALLRNVYQMASLQQLVVTGSPVTIPPGSLKKFLLTFSHALTAIRQKKDLVRVIESQLKCWLQFNYSTLFLYSRNRKFVHDFLSDPGCSTSGNPFRPVLDLRACSGNPDLRSYLTDRRDPRVRDGLLFDLYQGNIVIGHWVLLYEAGIPIEYGHPGLLQIVSNQLSIVVSGMLASQDKTIEEDERDHTLPGAGLRKHRRP